MAIKGEFLGKVIPIENNSGEDIEAYRVLTIASGKVAKAASNSDFYIGVSLYNNIYGETGETPNGEIIDVAINGVVNIVSATDGITVGTPVYAAGDGKIEKDGTLEVGIALDDGNTGDLIPVLLK